MKTQFKQNGLLLTFDNVDTTMNVTQQFIALGRSADWLHNIEFTVKYTFYSVVLTNGNLSLFCNCVYFNGCVKMRLPQYYCFSIQTTFNGIGNLFISSSPSAMLTNHCQIQYYVMCRIHCQVQKTVAVQRINKSVLFVTIRFC